MARTEHGRDPGPCRYHVVDTVSVVPGSLWGSYRAARGRVTKSSRKPVPTVAAQTADTFVAPWSTLRSLAAGDGRWCCSAERRSDDRGFGTKRVSQHPRPKIRRSRPFLLIGIGDTVVVGNGAAAVCVLASDVQESRHHVTAALAAHSACARRGGAVVFRDRAVPGRDGRGLRDSSASSAAMRRDTIRHRCRLAPPDLARVSTAEAHGTRARH